MDESSGSAPASHEALAVVLQVRDGRLQVLLWQRAREPFNGAWALPGGLLGPSETLEASIRRHLPPKSTSRS
jgi:ADP-ribose pyrophosphatase YjhB (NUDIX family)